MHAHFLALPVSFNVHLKQNQLSSRKIHLCSGCVAIGYTRGGIKEIRKEGNFFSFFLFPSLVCSLSLHNKDTGDKDMKMAKRGQIKTIFVLATINIYEFCKILFMV